MEKINSLLSIKLFILVGMILFSFEIQSQNLEQYADTARKQIIENQLTSGSWETYFNDDTVPKFRFHVKDAVYTGMILAELLEPLPAIFGLDTIVVSTWKYVTSKVDTSTGLLRFFNLFKNMPADADDTGLYWWQVAEVDSTMLSYVMENLEKNKAENGLYYVWFREGGLQTGLGHGDNPNPFDCMTNIHVYLALNRYAPELAKHLKDSINKFDLISNREYWIYNTWSPWLCYLREADLAECGWSINLQLDPEIRTVQGQDVFNEFAQYIADFKLKRITQKDRSKAIQLMKKMTKDDFAYFKKNPVLLYHNDLTFHTPRFFWSYDVSYALWLRLYYEYYKSMGKFQ